MKTEFYYRNTDVLLMDPCYSRKYDDDEDSELYCSDLIFYTYADGYYYVVKGCIRDLIGDLDNMAENIKAYSIGELTLDTARIGVYDYHKAIEEQPELKKQIEKKKIIAAVIRNFTGLITSYKDDNGENYLVGKSDDGIHDFFVVAL